MTKSIPWNPDWEAPRPRAASPADAVYSQPGRPVVFRLHTPWSAPAVELRGDLVHWHEGMPMHALDSGHGWELGLQVPEGVHGYKFLVGGNAWLLDPANPRTRGVDGARNSVLSIGGCDEPVLHAPVSPWVFLHDDGRVCVRAALRRGAGDSLVVRWDEGHGVRQAAMAPVGLEDEHVLLEATLPASAAGFEYRFLLASGDYVGVAGNPCESLRVNRRALVRGAPSWWRDAVLYTVFVDRFRRGGAQGGWSNRALSLETGERAGGDLHGITEALPYLQDLGVRAIHLTPIVVSPSAHRYDAVDPRAVDPALGGERAWDRLVEEANARGLKLLLDLSVTHVHRDFFAFRDVREHGRRSPYWDWFYIDSHPFREGLAPGYLHYRKGQWQEPSLRLDHPEVVAFHVGTIEHWARRGADGFRIDAAADVPIVLTDRMTLAARRVNPDITVFGEVIPENISRWSAHAVDSCTDFGSQQALYDLIWRRSAGAARTAECLQRRRFRRGGPGWSAIGFTATHDQHRLLSLTGNPDIARLGLLMVLMRADVPSLYYGDEVGLSCGHGERSFEDAWPDRQCMPWDPCRWHGRTRALVRDALALRRREPAIGQGDELFQAAQGPEGNPLDSVLVIRRTWGERIVDVLLHAGEGTVTAALPSGAPSGARAELELGEVSVDSGAGTVALGPWAAAVLRRELPPETRKEWERLRGGNAERAARAFLDGEEQGSFLPSHLYLTVTEACNLRCAHCINDSPARTRDGTARELRPWLIERLREALAAARYVAFTHGGESLHSPMLRVVLEALRQARAGRTDRCDVHLLTNGMLLTGHATRELIGLGVTSLGVSIDGARPETHDAIRLGSRFEEVVENVRDAVRVRREETADLRIGVSVVIGETNVHELPEFGRLALELGIDWLKIEETFPSTEFAARDFVRPDDARVLAGMERLRGLTKGTGLVVVDHLRAPHGCPCDARRNPELGAFREADNFANRAQFLSCRMAWDQACVDPHGTVHAVDYLHPPIGNLHDETMLDLWNNDAVRQLRKEALVRYPREVREACPFVPSRTSREET